MSSGFQSAVHQTVSLQGFSHQSTTPDFFRISVSPPHFRSSGFQSAVQKKKKNFLVQISFSNYPPLTFPFSVSTPPNLLSLCFSISVSSPPKLLSLLFDFSQQSTKTPVSLLFDISQQSTKTPVSLLFDFGQQSTKTSRLFALRFRSAVHQNVPSLCFAISVSSPLKRPVSLLFDFSQQSTKTSRLFAFRFQSAVSYNFFSLPDFSQLSIVPSDRFLASGICPPQRLISSSLNQLETCVSNFKRDRWLRDQRPSSTVTSSTL